MLNLPPPLRDDAADFQTAVESTTQAPKKAHLTAIKTEVVEAYGRYERAIAGADTCPAIGLTQDVQDTLEFTYDAMRTRLCLRPIREALLGAETLNAYCPLCGVEQVATLDHYVPKKAYPEFSIFSLNLVPACGRCNHDKGDATAATVEDAPFLHPYFHVLPAAPVLHADVIVENTSVFASFSLVTPTPLPARLASKLANQLSVLKTLRKIERAAQDDLISTAALCEALHAHGGAAAVAKAYNDVADDITLLRGVNHWRAVLHRAVARSEAFCDGGYSLLRPAAG